jgi:DNA-binding TFAR19-related protein (PDSD5 family)
MTDRLERIEALIESNAKSIEALTHQMNQDRDEAKQDRTEMKKILEHQRRDRAHVFEWMARLAAAQADFYEAQTYYMTQSEQMHEKLTEILNRLTPDSWIAIAFYRVGKGRSLFYSPYSDKNTRKSLKAALVSGELSS